jgi:hypothetical protein
MSAEKSPEAPALPPPGEEEASSLKDRAFQLAHDADEALNGLSDAIGLTEKVEKHPYGAVAAALGVGYVIGGGLFTPTTVRLLQLGLKLASVPLVKNRLIDAAEVAVDHLVASANTDPDPEA